MKDKVPRSMRMSSLFVVALILLLAGACGTRPALIEDLPIYPGMVAAQPGQYSLADSVTTAMQQSADEQGLNGQFRLFTLPAGTTWDQVQGFYSQKMAALKWKAEPTMTIEGEGFQAVGWSQGTGNNQQALVVGFVPDVTGEGAFVVLGLLSRQG